MTLRADLQELAIRSLRKTAEKSEDGFANASQVQRALDLLGEHVSLGFLTRLCNLNGIPIRQGRRKGAVDPRAPRGGRRPLAEGGTTSSTSEAMRNMAWRLKSEGKSLQQIADAVGPEFSRTITKQGIAKLLEHPPTDGQEKVNKIG